MQRERETIEKEIISKRPKKKKKKNLIRILIQVQHDTSSNFKTLPLISVQILLSLPPQLSVIRFWWSSLQSHISLCIFFHCIYLYIISLSDFDEIFDFSIWVLGISWRENRIGGNQRSFLRFWELGFAGIWVGN